MTSPDDTIDFSRIQERVSRSLSEHLRRTGSSLMSDPAVRDELTEQVRSILSLAFTRLGVTWESDDAAAPAEPRGAVIGDLRARQNIHPVDSLTAATVLFDIALSVIVDDDNADIDPVQLAGALNAAIMSNVIPASVAYVNVLLERLAVAQSEERLRISRDLHDRVAHNIAAGIQRIHLSDADDHEDPALREARELLTSALDETRAMALDLRQIVGDRTLDEAIRNYVLDLDSTGPRVVVESDGAPYRLSVGTQEEAFIIIREAIHNARRHSGADRILVRSAWDEEEVVIQIVDDGRGFHRSDVRSGSLGLIAAQERAELIGADLAIDPRPDSGTSVTLTLFRNEGIL